MIVTVANAKGGVGKTTTSVFLAHALTRATGALCAIVDTDPQASAWQWSRQAGRDGRPLDVPVLAQPSARLHAPAAPHFVIDTPPADLEIVAAAIELADVVLIPTSPSSLDLSRVQVTLEAAARADRQAVVLLTRTRRTRSVAEAEEGLRGIGARVLDTRIALRESVAMAFGRPVHDLNGYDLVVAELLGALGEQPFSMDAVRHRVVRHRPVVPAVSVVPAGPPVPRLRSQPQPVPRANPLGDDAMVQRLKSSVARLAAQR